MKFEIYSPGPARSASTKTNPSPLDGRGAPFHKKGFVGEEARRIVRDGPSGALAWLLDHLVGEQQDRLRHS
jgi:hypothetical protein